MIPVLVMIASCIGCKNAETPPKNSISVDQRNAAIESAMVNLDAGKILEALAITTQLVDKDKLASASHEAHALVLLAFANKCEIEGDSIKANTQKFKALNAYKLACEHSNDPGLLMLSTAQIAQMLGEVETAESYYTLTNDAIESDGRAAFFLAQMSMLQEEWSEAQKWINVSKSRDPFEPHTLLSSALIEAQLGNKTEAIELAKQGCKINPDNSNLRFIQARVFRLCGQPSRALELLNDLPQTLLNSPLCQEEINICILLLEKEKP